MRRIRSQYNALIRIAARYFIYSILQYHFSQIDFKVCLVCQLE